MKHAYNMVTLNSNTNCSSGVQVAHVKIHLYHVRDLQEMAPERWNDDLYAVEWCPIIHLKFWLDIRLSKCWDTSFLMEVLGIVAPSLIN